jgi:hypothetical protein
MRRIFVSLLLTILFLATSVSPAFARKEVKSKLKQLQHASYHEVTMVDRDDNGKIIDGGTCSAMAIGPHTLILAEHCDDRYTNQVYVDAPLEDIKARTARTYSATKQFDHQDHMLLDLAQITFPAYISFEGKTVFPVQGEHFYYFGSPAGIRDQYREGYITGTLPFTPKDDPDIDASGPLFMGVGPVVPGDSGSLIFDAQTGEAIGIVTYGIGDGSFVGIFPIEFTQAQIAQSKAPVDTVPEPPARPTGADFHFQFLS